jgi:hypothetical protein
MGGGLMISEGVVGCDVRIRACVGDLGFLSVSFPRFSVLTPSGLASRSSTQVKDKSFELEMCWVGAESGNKHQMVPKALREEAEVAAKAALEEGMEDD